MDPRRGARLRILGAAACFSTGGALIKACALSAWQVASFRSAVGAVAILLMAPESRRGWRAGTLLVGCAYAATVLLFVLANRATTSADAIYLQSTAPLYLVLIGPLFLHERPRGRDLVFVAALVLGLACFFVGKEAATRTAPDPATGNLLALGSGLSWAMTVAGLRWLARRDPSSGNSAVAATVAGNAIAFLVALPFALPVASATPRDLGIVVVLGVFQIGLAYVLLTHAARHVPALEAALLLLLEPVLNPLWAWLLDGEVPAAWPVVGAAVILVATAWHATRDPEPVPPSPD